MHIVFIIIAAVLGVVLPDMAWADGVLTPVHGNTWDLYVFGNGRVVFDILNSIKMLMVPDAGSSGFQTLLLCMASLGFLVLAIAAGFDPGKNLLRMFSYILVVWAVSWGSTSLTANVNINDLVVSQDGLSSTYTVDRVPALVALPAALTSQVGWYFSRVIETYFSTPSEFKIAGGNAGQFNLFAKMVQEGNEFVFTDPGLKQTMQAYVTDCVVPALALNRFHGQVKDPLTGAVSDQYGAAVLSQSVNLMDAFATAKHNAIMTKVFRSIFDAPTTTGSTDAATGMGTIMTCSDAYGSLLKMTNANAEAIVGASAAAYAKAGIMTPYETLASTMLAGASAPGGSGSTYSRPQGFILQQSMLNSMNGSFRQAALQTGNNELLTAASIAQAEQNQRAGWVSSFQTFNNMMGYVFTVLQAFIFAITPMIVVALMVPGLGKSIFANYAQILIWLMLWMPMLSLINYIITLFGTESIGSAMAVSGGVSLSNKGMLTERTNNMVIAAQFLGTMVPLLTWGLVKGAMAFTEFISHGVGNAFASQAGATASSGNLSLNNMSMDNASMNKFNTAMSSTVGTQATNAFSNAGALMASHDMAGSAVMKSGSGVDAKKAASESLSSSIQESEAVSKVMSDSMSKASSIEEAYQIAKSSGNSHAHQLAAARILSTAQAVSRGEGAGQGMSVDERQQFADAASRMQGLSKGNHVGAGINGKAGFEVFGSGAAVTTDAGMRKEAKEGQDHTIQANKSHGAGMDSKIDINKVSSSTGAGDNRSAATTDQTSTSSSTDRSSRHGMSASEQHAMQDAISAQNSITKSLSAAKSTVDSFGVANDMDMQTVNQHIAQLDGLRNELAGNAAQLDAKASALTGELTGHRAQTQAAIDSTHGKVAAADKGLGAGSGAPAGFAATSAAATSTMTEVKGDIATQKAAITKQHGEVTGKAEEQRANMSFKSGSPSVMNDSFVDPNTGKPGESPAQKLNPTNGPHRHPRAR
jgi:hypothetical protein